MTLVVAAFDEAQFTIVSDTKVTWAYADGHLDAARNRDTHFEALGTAARRGDI